MPFYWAHSSLKSIFSRIEELVFCPHDMNSKQYLSGITNYEIVLKIKVDPCMLILRLIYLVKLTKNVLSLHNRELVALR